MEALIGLLLLLLFSFLAFRYGHNSLPGIGSPEARLAEYLKPRDWLGAA